MGGNYNSCCNEACDTEMYYVWIYFKQSDTDINAINEPFDNLGMLIIKVSKDYFSTLSVIKNLELWINKNMQTYEYDGIHPCQTQNFLRNSSTLENRND